MRGATPEAKKALARVLGESMDAGELLMTFSGLLETICGQKFRYALTLAESLTGPVDPKDNGPHAVKAAIIVITAIEGTVEILEGKHEDRLPSLKRILTDNATRWAAPAIETNQMRRRVMKILENACLEAASLMKDGE